MPFQDARYAQIIALSLFLMLGVWTRDWNVCGDRLAAIFAACWLTQLFLSLCVNLAKRRQNDDLILVRPSFLQSISDLLALDSLKSAAITALGLALLLRSNHLSTLILASCLAIASKFILRMKGKHFFNPANFGIIGVLLLTQDAWVSPGQWGTESGYLLLFLAIGGLILRKVGRWDTSMVFFGTYGGLLLLRNVWLGWGGDVSLHQLTGGSLWIFAFFMITDPRSIPDSAKGRILWAMGIGLLTFSLQFGLYLTTAPFWALFCISPFTPLFDAVWTAPRFTWQPLKTQRSPSPSP